MKVDIPKQWSVKMAALEGDAEIGAGHLISEDEAKTFFQRWQHVGVAFGFYPLDWNIKPTWGPFVHTVNFGPFALTFLF